MAIAYLLLLCASVLNVKGQLNVSISPIEDYNVAPPIGQNITVEFRCTSTATTIEWRVNDTVSNDMIIASRGVTFTTPVETDGLFSSSLFIPASQDIGKTSILCRAADLGANPPVVENSQFVYLNIQGLLGPPPNLTLLEADEQLTRLLRWDAPETLDITNVDPDIQNYQVCYNLSATEMTCTNVSSEGEREFKFSNVRVPLLFTVSAFNVVGEGSASTVVHQPSNCSNAEGGLSL